MLGVSALRSLRPPAGIQGALNFTRLRIRDTDSTDRLRFRTDFSLGAGTNGIDPAIEPVAIKLSTPAGPFYEQVPSGFTLEAGGGTRKRYALNATERARTGIERLEIKDEGNTSGSRSRILPCHSRCSRKIPNSSRPGRSRIEVRNLVVRLSASLTCNTPEVQRAVWQAYQKLDWAALARLLEPR